MIGKLRKLYCSVFGALESATEGWFPGLAARFVFLAVLFFYFFNAWGTKVGDGFPGLLSVRENAWHQIVPWAVEAAGGEVSQVGFVHDMIVVSGTFAELLLPMMIVAGLFARLAALGMMVFIAVQSFVDIRFHQVGPETTGALFDRFSDSLIADQRTLWAFLLLVIVIKGAGALSIDALFGRMFARAA